MIASSQKAIPSENDLPMRKLTQAPESFSTESSSDLAWDSKGHHRAGFKRGKIESKTYQVWRGWTINDDL